MATSSKTGCPAILKLPKELIVKNETYKFLYLMFVVSINFNIVIIKSINYWASEKASFLIIQYIMWKAY